MKKINLMFCLLAVVFGAACTKPSNQSESASSAEPVCEFDIHVFSTYTNESGKLIYSSVEMEGWTKQGTHDYAIESSSDVESASVEILKEGKTLKKFDVTLKKLNKKLTQLVDNGQVKEVLRGMKPSGSKMTLKFAFDPKKKSGCKKDVNIFLD